MSEFKLFVVGEDTAEPAMWLKPYELVVAKDIKQALAVAEARPGTPCCEIPLDGPKSIAFIYEADGDL